MPEFVVSADDADQEFTEVEAAADKPQRWPAMTYEQGVRDALGWVLGYREEPPYTQDDSPAVSTPTMSTRRKKERR